jgi:hypothetical protein
MLQAKVYGIEQTVAELRRFNDDAIIELRKDLRDSAKPIATAIKAYIPTAAPLSGMQHNGRTSWQPQNVKVAVKTSFTRRAARNELSIVSIVVGGKKGTIGAAGLQLADMAGIANKTTTGMTREYTRNGKASQHRRNGQGKALIEYLNGRYSSASRFVWRGAQTQLPMVRAAVLVSLEKASRKVNARLVMK